jgi:hypothetical protein
MSRQSFVILATVVVVVTLAMALASVTPVRAAPLAQTTVDEAVVDEVIVTSATTFTLTVRLDEVTTFAIPLQVDWLAEGPTEGNEDEVTVTISPTVLQRGFFSVTVGTVEPTTGTLTVVLAQPPDEAADDDSPITGTSTTTATVPAIDTDTTTDTTTTTSTVSGPTTNAISNLRAGPGTDFAIVGSAETGAALDVVGQNSDGTWLSLADGSWIAAFLVNNVPAGLPVVEPTATPLPTAAPSDVVTPTLIPTATPTP